MATTRRLRAAHWAVAGSKADRRWALGGGAHAGSHAAARVDTMIMPGQLLLASNFRKKSCCSLALSLLLVMVWPSHLSGYLPIYTVYSTNNTVCHGS